MYKLISKLVDNNGKVIGYRLKEVGTKNSFKYRTEDVFKLAKSNKIVNSRMIGNTLSLLGFDMDLLYNETHGDTGYTLDITIVDNEEVNRLHYKQYDTVDLCIYAIDRILDTYNVRIAGSVKADVVKYKLTDDMYGYFDIFRTADEYCILKQEVAILKISKVNRFNMDISKFIGSIRNYIMDSHDILDIDMDVLGYTLQQIMFGGYLSDILSIEMSNRLTRCAGLCKFNKSLKGVITNSNITISKHYHDKYREELITTCVHELMHLLPDCSGHDYVYQKVCDYVMAMYGLDIQLKSKERALVKYIYTCPNCNTQWKRSRKLSNENHRLCGKCKVKLERHDCV